MLTLKDKIELIRTYDTDKNGAYKEYISKGMSGNYSTFDRSLRKWKSNKSIKEAIQNQKEQGDYIEKNANPYGNYNAKRATIQTDSDGNLIQQWTKIEAKDVIKEEYKELLNRLDSIKPKEYISNKVNNTNNFLEIGLFDMHFGINDLNYYKTVLDKVSNIISNNNREKIYFIIGQDLFHCDNFKGTTVSGTQMEVFLKEDDWEQALTFYTHLIDTALNHSKSIEVIYSKGNHDESITYGFVRELKAYYRNYNNISFDLEIQEYKARKIGNTMIVFTHSDELKMNAETALKMQNYFKDIWIDCENMEIHAGHLHHLITKEYAGSVLRQQSSAAKTDKWHRDNGFIETQKMFQLYEYSTEGLETIFNIRR